MKTVFILQHMYEYGKEGEHEESKFLGVYSSERKAVEARSTYYLLPGFKDHPLECFYIEKFIIDKEAEWKEGFISWDEATSVETDGT